MTKCSIEPEKLDSVSPILCTQDESAVWPQYTHNDRVLWPAAHAIGTLAPQLSLSRTPRPRPTSVQHRATVIDIRVDTLERQPAALVRTVAEGQR